VVQNTQALAQRAKACSVSGFALLDLRSRNHARSAFKRFFTTQPEPFIEMMENAKVAILSADFFEKT